MSEKKPSKKISRRRFMQNMGTGIAGAYVASVPLKNLPAQDRDSSENRYVLKTTVNGKPVKKEIFAEMTLAEFIRETLLLTGTKISCNQGECGACTVLLDGKAVYSCHMLALEAEGKKILTIEGLMSGEKLHPLQQSFIENDGLQCGFCTPGQIMSAYSLLLHNPEPKPHEIREAMSGNLCRCAAYPNILKSVSAAAAMMKKGGFK